MSFSTRRKDRALVSLDDKFLEQLSVTATTPQLSTWKEANLKSIFRSTVRTFEALV